MFSRFLIAMFSLSSVFAAQANEPRPGPGGIVECWTNPDGTQQCQDGPRVVPRPERPPSNRPNPPHYPPERPNQPPRPLPPSRPDYPPPSRPDYPPSYGVQQFRYDEQQVLRFEADYQRAPSGSWDEDYARRQRDQFIQRAIDDLSSPRALEGMALHEAEQFALELESSYQRAKANSAPERMYDQARKLVFNNLNYVLQDELARLYSFQDAEAIGLDYEAKYQRAAARSLPESAYLSLRKTALSEAVNRFNSEAYRMDRNTLYNIQADYNARYQRAPANSASEAYYLQIRNIARGLL